MKNYLDAKSDRGIQARERAHHHAGILLALHLSDTHTLGDAPSFHPDKPTPANTTGLPVATAMGILVTAISYEVDIVVHYKHNDTFHFAIGDHLAYLRDGGHHRKAFKPDHNGDHFLDDREGWVETTYETIVLTHWTAVSSIAEILIDDPSLAQDQTLLENMLRVTGPSAWGFPWVDDSGRDDDHDDCFDCNGW